MPKMTKANAREILMNTLKNFQSVSGERIASVFTWNGILSTLGPEAFKQCIFLHKEDIWKSLAYLIPIEAKFSKPAHDEEIELLLEADYTKFNVSTLRKVISWVTKKRVPLYSMFHTVQWNSFSTYFFLFPRLVS